MVVRVRPLVVGGSCIWNLDFLILDLRFRSLDFLILEFGFWSLDFLNFGCFDFGIWILESGHGGN